MNRILIIITAVLLCMASALNAQNVPVVQIGTGIDTSEYLPTNVFSDYSLSQQIYTAAEIGQSGTIYGIAFYNISPSINRNLDVYLVHTNKTAFTGSTDWSAVTAGYLVFSGNITFQQDEWTVLECAPPFVYNGTDNLLVVVDDNTNGWLDDRQFRVFAAPNQALADNDDYTDYDPTVPSNYSGSVLSVKNQIQLSFVPAQCPAPSSLTFTNISSTSATLSWTENGSATAWDICLNGDESNIITVDTTFYTLTDLLPNTNYTVKIRANCGGSDGVSAWVASSFLTSTCSTPSIVYVSNVSQDSVTLNWTDDGSASVWEISVNGDYENAITVYTNPYVLTGLTPNTIYDVEVRAICGDSNNVSYWTHTTFTTLSDYQVQSNTYWYGYAFHSLLENSEFSDHDWEKEFISFTMQDPSIVTAATSINPSLPYTYAATYANGYVWCITYEDGHLCRASIDLNTQTISNFEIIAPDFEIGHIILAMSYNPVDGNIYYITTESALKRINPNQPNEFTYVGFFDFDALTLAINHSGEGYLIQDNTTSDLYQLNLSDASVTFIGSTGLQSHAIQSMAFDQSTGELFWAQYYNQYNRPSLYLVDPATAETQYLGSIGGGGCQLAGLFMVDTSQHVGVQSHLSGDVTLYPNPANNVVNVQWTTDNDPWDVEAIEVLDVYGKVVRTVGVGANHYSPLQTARINVSGLATGLYFVRVTTSAGQITRPFVKN